MRPARRGMSFLEITIVLLVIAVMAAVATPRFTQTVRVNQLDAAQTRVRSVIEYVRQVAVNEGRTTSLTFNGTTDSITSTNTNAPGTIGVPINIDLHAEYDDSIELSAAFDGSISLSFDLEGAPRVGGSEMQSGVITLRSLADTVRIRVVPDLGTTEILTVQLTPSPVDDIVESSVIETEVVQP